MWLDLLFQTGKHVKAAWTSRPVYTLEETGALSGGWSLYVYHISRDLGRGCRGIASSRGLRSGDALTPKSRSYNLSASTLPEAAVGIFRNSRIHR